MSSFKSWFGSKSKSDGAGDLESQLKALEKESDRAGPGFQWGPLNRAGDLCLRLGERERALKYYGRTIDTLLVDEQREAARGVANKIIRVHPGAVRTLCTLTWLDLGAQHMATALLHLRDYVDAALAAGQETRASDQILDMARLIADDEFLAAAADALDRLDFPEKAGIAREWQRAGGSPDAVSAEGRSEACMQSAVNSNEWGGDVELIEG